MCACVCARACAPLAHLVGLLAVGERVAVVGEHVCLVAVVVNGGSGSSGGVVVVVVVTVTAAAAAAAVA